jgi:hypothetical protein
MHGLKVPRKFFFIPRPAEYCDNAPWGLDPLCPLFRIYWQIVAGVSDPSLHALDESGPPYLP